MTKRGLSVLAVLCILLACLPNSYASQKANRSQDAVRESIANADGVSKVPAPLQDIGIQEHLGNNVSLSELTFRNEEGQDVRLAEYFSKGKPVLLNLVYYNCTTLCGFVLSGLLDSLKALDWTPGQQFEIVTISINPRETAELAKAKKANFLEAYGRQGAEAGWHFLTGEEAQIRKLASEVGFGYKYVEEEEQYAHGAAIFVLTPQGKISRYLYGIEYPEKDLKLALLEASDGKVGTVIERILLFCYRYDPKARKYSVYVTKIMQAGGAGTVLVFGGYLAVFWRRQRKSGQDHVQGG